MSFGEASRRWAEINGAYRTPLLTAAQEIHYGTAIRRWLDWPGGPDHAPQQVQRRGRRARDRMVAGNLRWVVKIAGKYSHTSADPEELLQRGAIGLMRAAEKFDPARGYKFSTYAYWWIRAGITRLLEEQRREPVAVSLDALVAGTDDMRLVETIAGGELTIESAMRRDLAVEALAAVRDELGPDRWAVAERIHLEGCLQRDLLKRPGDRHRMQAARRRARAHHAVQLALAG